MKEYDPTAKKVIVTDMDEVLVNISHIWYNLLTSKRTFDTHFNYNKDWTPSDILNRDEYYLNKWLLKDGVGELPPDKLQEFLAVYDTPTFYQDHCSLTTFGNGIRLMGMQQVIGKIYVLSHCVSQQSADSKCKFLSKVYKDISGKVEFIPIFNDNVDKPAKYEFLKNVDFDMYAEDRLDVVEDVIDNVDSAGKEFIMPNLGYNKVTPEFIEKIAMNDIQYSRYDNVF